MAEAKSIEPELPDELQKAIELLRERKARDLTLLDLSEVSGVTDYFLIASGTSDTHVKSIGDHLIDEFKKEGVRAGHVEGLRGGNWVLVDFFDFVVHIFHPSAREFYQLETLWGDAPAFELAE